jgi:hypothetical protein
MAHGLNVERRPNNASFSDPTKQIHPEKINRLAMQRISLQILSD